jgi:Ca-activated chloride channel family protein
MSFQHPGFLWLALLLPIALMLKGRPPTVLFAPARFLRDVPRTARSRLLSLPTILQVVGLALVVLSLARPVRRVPVPHERDGIDILLCIDVSSSMLETDLENAKTRLEVVRNAAARFIDARADDRIGIVTFARFPDLRSPPTRDHAFLRRVLTGIQPVQSDSEEDATGIGAAVAKSAQVLGRGVVVLLTDGEENVATADKPREIAPVHAGQLCRELGVRAYTIQAGRGRRTAEGKWLEIDTKPIRSLAETSGGRFFAAKDAQAVDAVYAEIDEIERMRFAEPDYRNVEKFLPLLSGAIGLLILGRFLRTVVLP